MGRVFSQRKDARPPVHGPASAKAEAKRHGGKTGARHPQFPGRGPGNHRVSKVSLSWLRRVGPSLARQIWRGTQWGPSALLSERALLTAYSHVTGPSVQRAVLLPGEPMALLAQGQSWGRKWGPSTPDPPRFHLRCCPHPTVLSKDVTHPPVTQVAFVHRLCLALHKDPGLMM